MTGEVDSRGTPIVRLTIGNREWVPVIDTGFDGDLELPEDLAAHFQKTSAGPLRTTVAAGAVIEEEIFFVDFPFDGDVVPVHTSFAPTTEILIGTGLLRRHRLEIDFVRRTVVLEKLLDL
jgi:predicted aspartyl protease